MLPGPNGSPGQGDRLPAGELGNEFRLPTRRGGGTQMTHDEPSRTIAEPKELLLGYLD
jgi:hypothetical protein